MKRCPECRRDYYDNTLLYCLDDGAALLDGPNDFEEPATAILEEKALAERDRRSPPNPQNSKTKELANNKRNWLLLALPILAVIVLGGFFGYRYFKPATGKINSIAVLPFQNKSTEPDTDYLSDGLAESLIYRLSQLPDPKVSPTSTVFRYKGSDSDPLEIAKELGEKDEALKWLEMGYEEHAFQMQMLKVDPRWDELRSDPRFVDLMRRINLPVDDNYENTKK